MEREPGVAGFRLALRPEFIDELNIDLIALHTIKSV